MFEGSLSRWHLHTRVERSAHAGARSVALGSTPLTGSISARRRRQMRVSAMSFSASGICAPHHNHEFVLRPECQKYKKSGYVFKTF